MLIRLLDPTDEIAAQSQGNVLVLDVIPKDGQAFQMFQQNFGFVTRGRLVNQGAGLTNLLVQISADEFGAPAGVEATVATYSSTSVVGATSYPLPSVRVFQTGSSTAPSTASIWLGFGYPVKDIVAKEVRGLTNWAVGDSIFDAKHRWRIRGL
jgi:hypothetical protein